MSAHGPSGSATAAAGDACTYGTCDAVVLVCLALASGLIVVTVVVCFRRAMAYGNAAGGAAPLAGNIGRRGLAPSALAAIPKFEYRRAGAAGGWAQCAICLGLVRDGEAVRLLPACGHLFHVDCVDMWLYSHATCPLCRCDVGEAAAATGEKV